MPIVEKSGLMKYKDAAGNTTIMYPITNTDSVDGLEEWSKAMLLKSVMVTLPASAEWRSVCYGNGKFVAVAYNSNAVVYSTDGINWTRTTLPASTRWRSVCYGNGKFVVVAQDSNAVVYSTDGITWTRTTLPASASWRSVCYGNGKFVAVAFDNTIAAYSIDGITWTQTTLPSSAYWYSVCYGDGKFVAVTYDSTIAAYSVDGINWTNTAHKVSNPAGTDITANLNKALGAATMTEVNTAIQSAIQNTWEASY